MRQRRIVLVTLLNLTFFCSLQPAWAETLSWTGIQAEDGIPAAVSPPGPAESPASGTPKSDISNGMNFLTLLVLGGWFMIPLAGISFVTVALAVERWLALRKERHLPERLVERLGRLSEQPGGMDPRDAYRICQAYPSSASTILRKVLVKVGRPHAELETALNDAAQRNAIRLQQPVSWLNWCAAVAPLLGLLGTVWGITQAFYDTTQLEVGQNQADALASGIYMALVTTIFGLVIAIPATTFSHYFENRIVSLSTEIEEMVASLLPQLERYEGQIRFAVDEAAESGPPSSTSPRSGRKTSEGLPLPEKRSRASL